MRTGEVVLSLMGLEGKGVPNFRVFDEQEKSELRLTADRILVVLPAGDSFRGDVEQGGQIGLTQTHSLARELEFIAVDRLGVREDCERGLDLETTPFLVGDAPGIVVLDARRLVFAGDLVATDEKGVFAFQCVKSPCMRR